MPANHRLEVGLEKRALRRCKSVKLGTSEECPQTTKGHVKKAFLKRCSAKSR